MFGMIFQFRALWSVLVRSLAKTVNIILDNDNLSFSLQLLCNHHYSTIKFQGCQIFSLTLNFLGKLYLYVLTMSFAKNHKYITTVTMLSAKMGIDIPTSVTESIYHQECL